MAEKKPAKKKAETKEQFGRPTKYNATVQKQAEDYLKNHKTKYGDEVPTVCGLAYQLGVVEKTLYNWGVSHNDFLHTLESIQNRQKNLLINKGLDNTFQPTIAKLMLANHGLHDKTDMTLSGQDGTPVKFEYVDTSTEKV